MASVKGLPWYKHVTFGALGEGLIILLQDRKCVLHVVVHKLDIQVGLACLTFPDTPSSGIAQFPAYLGKRSSSDGPPRGNTF